jgi:glucokinase
VSTDALFAGADLGGTKILTVVSDHSGREVGSSLVETLAQEGRDAVIARIVASVEQAVRAAGREMRDLAAIGVSAPGPIDLIEGVITHPPNLPGWEDVPLARILRDRTGITSVLENDANCGALGEHAFGAGRGFRHMIYMTVSTGIGGGIIVNNEMYSGASGGAGEVGHMGVSPDGPPCNAGHPGCLEGIASGTAIAARARALIADGQLPLTARLAGDQPPAARTVQMAARGGEDGARQLIVEAGLALGIGLASLVNAFNPQAIVLGGGLMKMGDMLLDPAIETARERSFDQNFGDVRIVEAELGDRSPALGAITLAQAAARHEAE